MAREPRVVASQGYARQEHLEEDGSYQRLFVNLGTKDGFYKASFLQFILDMSDLKKEVLGRIDMKEMNSWIEIEPGCGKEDDKVQSTERILKGRKIRMNDAESGGKRKG